MTYPDPLDALTNLGLRVVWVRDLAAKSLLIRGEKIVLADPQVDRLDLVQSVLQAVLALPQPL